MSDGCKVTKPDSFFDQGEYEPLGENADYFDSLLRSMLRPLVWGSEPLPCVWKQIEAKLQHSAKSKRNQAILRIN